MERLTGFFLGTFHVRGWPTGAFSHWRGLTDGRRRELAEAALLFLLAVFLNAGALALRTQDHLAEKVVRLHVLADSDSPADQALKLAVRDAVLEEAGAVLEGAGNRQEAEARLREKLPELERAALKAAAEGGYGGPVRAELAEAAFPTRTYEDFSLPAGRYLALRVVIGTGGGRNWWCVVFPPLCGAAALATVPVAAMPDAGFSPEEIRLITGEGGGYVLRFKTVELWGSLRELHSRLLDR